MGYRDDFYVAGNIIGYTGDLNNFPTVYFLSLAPPEFGHITQDHWLRHNVGRETVHGSTGYTYANEVGSDGSQSLVERIHGRLKHRSRNPFTTVDDQNRGTLIQAIAAVEVQKKPHYVAEQLVPAMNGDDVILGAMFNKANVMNELQGKPLRR